MGIGLLPCNLELSGMEASIINAMSLTLAWMPKFMAWGKQLTQAVLGNSKLHMGYSYIKTFFGYVLTALLIAVVIVISNTFIDTVALDTENAVVRLLEYCLKMGRLRPA